MKIIPVILCGGQGDRLWPLSRPSFPKQFLSLTDPNHSMLQVTLKRLADLDYGTPIVICNTKHRFIVAEQLQAIDVEADIVLEPVGRNTAPAVACAALLNVRNDQDAILMVLPADHKLSDDPTFHTAQATALSLANQDHLVSFGIQPTHPATGYGYIHRGAACSQLEEAFLVREFVEKPDRDKAATYLASGDFYWNSGMFVFKASRYLQELQKFAPDILGSSKQALDKATQDLDFLRLDKAAFAACRSDSIDYAIMENTQTAAVVPLASAWSDVGTWPSLWETQAKDEQNNVITGDVYTDDVSNSYLRSDERLLVVLGMKDCVVVQTGDAVLVTDKAHSQQIKGVVEKLRSNNRNEADSHQEVFRPWGGYTIIAESTNFKVKRISIKPGHSVSLQLHKHRAEHWVIVTGKATVTRSEETFTLEPDQSTYIPVNTKHRIANNNDELLVFIEVQTGEYLGEDDIVRFDDIYGREKIPEEIPQPSFEREPA